MTPFPYRHLAYSHVPPHPEKKATAMYMPTGSGSGLRSNRNATTARPRHAETVCTTMSMAGDHNG